MEVLKLPNMQDLYKGRTIFVTGASGFLGKVLVEKMLFSLPGIERIYLLIRGSNGNSACGRWKQLEKASRVLFNRIRRECPDRLAKLVPVQGDIGLPELGLSTSDLERILAETSMVFHLAATVRFNAPLKEAVELNVEGAARVISLCHRMPKLEKKKKIFLGVLAEHIITLLGRRGQVEMKRLIHILPAYLHCSTTYVNSDRRWTIVEEKLYPPPCDPHKLIEAKDTMEWSLFESIGKGATRKYGNTYCFPKCLAEHLVAKDAADLPELIFRPAVIGSIWKDGIPGWIDAFQAGAALAVMFCTGAISRIPVDLDSYPDGVPVDVASSMMIACAAYRASMTTKNNPPVLHCNTASLNPATYKMYRDAAIECVEEYPFQNMLATPVGSHLGSDIVEKSMHNMREKYLGPAMDKVLVLAGQKPFFGRLFVRVNEAYNMFTRFLTGHTFKTDKLVQLLDMMTDEDKETFDFDVRKIDLMPYGYDCYFGCKAFLMKDDIGDPANHQKARRNLILHRLKDFGIWLILCYMITSFFAGSSTTWMIYLPLTLILFFCFTVFAWEKKGVPSIYAYVKKVEAAMGEPLNPKSSTMKISRNN